MALIFEPDFTDAAAIAADGGIASSITYEAGKVGPGVRITGPGNSRLYYPIAGTPNKFNYSKGTLEFWIKPEWDGRYAQSAVKYFFKVIWGATQQFFLPVYYTTSPTIIKNYLYPTFTTSARVLSIEPYSVMQWEPDTWHKIILYWDFTIADNLSYFVAKIDGTFTTFAKFAAITAEDLSGTAKIYIGSDSGGTGTPAYGVISDLKIYDESLLPVVPYPEYGFDPWTPATEATLRTLFSGDGFAANFETNATEPADCPVLDVGINPGVDVMFFQRPAFEPTYENYVPSAGEIVTTAAYTDAPGEYVPIFFNVYSRIALTNVQANFTAFSGAGSIAKANCDMRVVKNSFRATIGGGSVGEQLPYYKPVMLLHDDTVAIDSDNTLVNTKVPTLPVLSYAKTTMAAYTSRQFVLIVKIPDDAAAGVHTTTVTLSSDEAASITLTINLTVLPFVLQDSGKSPALWHYMAQDMLWITGMTPGFDIFDVMTADLQDIYNHGVKTVILASYHDSNNYPFYVNSTILASVEEKLAACQSIGISRPVVYITNLTTMAADMVACKALFSTYNFSEPWFYGKDEVGPSTYAEHEIIHGHVKTAPAGKIMVATTKTASDYLDTAGYPLDGILYTNYEQHINDLQSGAASLSGTKPVEGFYGQSRDMAANRFWYGYLPYLTGLQSPSLYVYRAVTAATRGLFNDFDTLYPPYALTYPSIDDVGTFRHVPTFYWEAVREGVKDGKYLATWEWWRNRVRNSHPAQVATSQAVIDALLTKYKDDNATTCPAQNRVTQTQYATDRTAIIDEINTLKTLRGGDNFYSGVRAAKVNGVVPARA